MQCRSKGRQNQYPICINQSHFTENQILRNAQCRSVIQQWKLNNPEKQIAEFQFRFGERKCRHGRNENIKKCGYDRNKNGIKQIADGIREHFGKPLTISSGCRCATHNAKVGGVKGSRHVLGKASDIWISGVSKNDLMNKCKEYVSNGQANYTYSNESNMKYAVHIDVK